MRAIATGCSGLDGRSWRGWRGNGEMGALRCWMFFRGKGGGRRDAETDLRSCVLLNGGFPLKMVQVRNYSMVNTMLSQEKDTKENLKQYYLKNREKIRENQKQYYLKNKEATKIKQKLYRHKTKQAKLQYYLRNKENIQHQQKLYRMRNKDTIKHHQQQYRLKHLPALKEQQKQYRLKNHQALRKYFETNREAFRRYYLINKELISQKQKEYRQNNKETVKKIQKQYYLKTKQPRRSKIWNNQAEVRTFLEMASQKLYLRDPSEWYRVSRSQMEEIGGGGLYGIFGSLGKALQYAFPECEWDLSKFSLRGKKSTQRWLRVMLELILPEKTDVFEDFLHPELIWDEQTNLKMELDIWIPQYKIAIEYQGEHHFHDLCSAYGPNGTVSLYTKRDLKKKETCKERGITLITIPYWWDRQKESLSSTLHQVLPDIFPNTESPQIPLVPPNTMTRRDMVKNNDVAALLMHGREWNNEEDPTGWLISEKLDGFRAFWDGSRLYTRNGNPINVPEVFTQQLPRHVSLDGELWIDYDSFDKLSSILKKTSPEMSNQELEKLWKDVKYCVFDAPMHPGPYLERNTFAKDSISGCNSHISIIPVVSCLGQDHLQTILKEVIEKKGEGIMLYHPQEKYTSGRTNTLLKVKSFLEEDVKFVDISPNSYSFLCEQKNGAQCIVKCSGWDYLFPPSPGTVLTVKHRGLYDSSKKIKQPFLLRVRNDLYWY